MHTSGGSTKSCTDSRTESNRVTVCAHPFAACIPTGHDQDTKVSVPINIVITGTAHDQYQRTVVAGVTVVRTGRVHILGTWPCFRRTCQRKVGREWLRLQPFRRSQAKGTEPQKELEAGLTRASSDATYREAAILSSAADNDAKSARS